MFLRYCQKKHLNEAKNSHGMSQDVLDGIINCMPTARNFPEFHVHLFYYVSLKYRMKGCVLFLIFFVQQILSQSLFHCETVLPVILFPFLPR